MRTTTSHLANMMQAYTLKPTIIPPEFVLIQDTREQRPLFARIPKGLTIMSATLHDGDYSVKGFENGGIAFERKAGDLFSYCTSEQEKTKAKMKRLKNFEFAALIIEMKESDAYQFQQHSKCHPEAIRGALLSFQIRYGVHVIFAGNRENAARTVLDLAVRYWNVKHEI